MQLTEAVRTKPIRDIIDLLLELLIAVHTAGVALHPRDVAPILIAIGHVFEALFRLADPQPLLPLEVDKVVATLGARAE